jgi:hypothetical protein
MELAGLVGFCEQTKKRSVRRQLIHAIDDQLLVKTIAFNRRKHPFFSTKSL